MPNLKISQLVNGNPAQNGDLLPIDRSGMNFSISAGSIAALAIGGVTSVSNSDGTLTISPTTGAVVASLALSKANTWSATQTFGTITPTTISGAVNFSGTPTFAVGAGLGTGTFSGAATLSGNIAFTGTPTFANPVALGSSTATTQAGGTNNTTLATTAFVTSAVAAAGTVTSVSFTGGLISVATATTTPALTVAGTSGGIPYFSGATTWGSSALLASGGLVLGGGAGTAPLTNTQLTFSAPTLTVGLAGTSTGTIALASSTASGKFTITAPSSASTPTLTLPTSSGVAVNVADGTVFTSTIAASGTLSLAAQTANTVFSGPTSGSAGAPTFRSLVVADIPNTTITPIWNNLQNATGALTLANGTNTTEFDQTSNVAWLWANTTVATVSTTNASPLHEFAANYWTGSASAQDLWTVGSSLVAGPNGASTLTFTHTGSTGVAAVSVPRLLVPSGSGAVPSISFSTDTSTGIMLNGSGHFGISSGGTQIIDIQKINGLIINNGVPMGWGAFATADTSLSRISSGVVAVGTGAQGSAIGTINVATVTAPAVLTLISASGSDIVFEPGGTVEFAMQTTAFRGSSTCNIGFSSGAANAAASDTIISRLAAGVLAIGSSATSGSTTGNLAYNRVNVVGADYAGTATITAAGTSITVTYAANYTGAAAPVVVVTPTSDPLAAGIPVGYWVVATGVTTAWTGFTINIQTALASNVTFNYMVLGKA